MVVKSETDQASYEIKTGNLEIAAVLKTGAQCIGKGKGKATARENIRAYYTNRHRLGNKTNELRAKLMN